MKLTELFQDIQTFLNNENMTPDDKPEYERLLEEFYQIPSYIERFKQQDHPSEVEQ